MPVIADRQGQDKRTTRSALRYRTPGLNIVQIKSRLIEDADDLETALRMLTDATPWSVALDLEIISATANRIVDALRLSSGAML
jgi:hypothetical protein